MATSGDFDLAIDTAIDFTFDQPAFVTTATGFHLVLPDNTILTCQGPAPSTTNVSGGTIAGGNGTATITVICPNDAAGTSTTRLTAALVSRGYVDANTVADTQADATANIGAVPANQVNANPLESVNVSNGGLTTGADLQSAQFIPAGTGTNTSTTTDQVLYTFDQAVTGTPAPGGYSVFKTDGSQVFGIAPGYHG